MNDSREQLLQPSLSAEERLPSAPYTVQTTFLTGFFGGPFAAIAILAVNSVRLRRLLRDIPLLVATLALLLAGGWAIYNTGDGAQLRSWLDARMGENSLRYVYRIIALCIVGLGYWAHRREQRSAQLTGLDRPNGWIAGLACIALGVALMVGYVAVLMR